jgi:hypothetical protein
MKNFIFNPVVWGILIAAFLVSACSSATIQNQPSSTNGYAAQTELIASTDAPEDGTHLDFGTTGNLRNSDLVMYDRQTESWWQQFTGEAIVGDLTGNMLEFLLSHIISWSEFKTANPYAEVLSRDTGHQRSYGENPYPGYDDLNSSPWFPGLDDDERLPAMERVAAVVIDGEAKAYPFSSLEMNRVVNDIVNGAPIVVFWMGGTRTTFGNFPTDVGSSSVFSRELEDHVLTFTPADDRYQDLETGTLWNILGQAVS